MNTRRYRTGALLGSLVFSLGAPGLQAQDERPAPPPPQAEHHTPPPNAPEGARAEKIRERIRELHAAGRHEEADRMVERVRQAQMKMVQRPMADRTPGGKTDGIPVGKADRKEDRKTHASHPEREGPPPPMGPPPVMKIRNLKMAADLLDDAGYREYAEKARHEAGRIEGEMRKMMEMKKRGDEKRRAEEAKRRDMEKRKAEDKKDRPDPDAAIRKEVKELRRELEELRRQLKKSKAEAESRADRDRREEDRPD